MPTFSQQIIDAARAWPGVEVTPGRFGAVALVVGRRELGHLHGDHAAHFAFPKTVRADLYAQGRVTAHPALPNSPGMAARRIAGEDDVQDVVAMLRLNYDRLAAR